MTVKQMFTDEEQIRLHFYHRTEFAEELVKAFKIKQKVESMIKYLKDEIKRTEVESYRNLCKQELIVYEGIINVEQKVGSVE